MSSNTQPPFEYGQIWKCHSGKIWRVMKVKNNRAYLMQISTDRLAIRPQGMSEGWQMVRHERPTARPLATTNEG